MKAEKYHTGVVVLLAVTTIVILVMVVKFDGATARRYHRSWCEERLSGVSVADTLEIVQDDGFCLKVIQP